MDQLSLSLILPLMCVYHLFLILALLDGEINDLSKCGLGHDRNRGG